MGSPVLCQQTLLEHRTQNENNSSEIRTRDLSPNVVKKLSLLACVIAQKIAVLF
jgi:hypothetical protein